MIICIIIIILLIITILSLILYNKQNKQKLEKELQEKVEQEFINNRKKELEEYLLIESADAREKARLSHELYVAGLREEQQKLQGIIATGEATIRELEKRKEEQLKAITEQANSQKKLVEVEVAAYRDIEMQKARTAVESETEANKKWAASSLTIYWDELAQSTYETEQELQQAKAELEEYRKKQQAVNEAILRQRAIDEQQDFYRVCLSENAIEDIKLLQEIRQKLHTSDNLNKLIYDVYVSKSVQEMVKRVLQGGAPSGIYKITRLKTGEIYIGKSTNVKDRWIQHCKTVYGAGTIAHSILHTTMAKDGLEQFTFELVEEVPKDKLTEREKYWITFYGSKEYGLNERNG